MNPFEAILTLDAQVDIRRLGASVQTHILKRLEWMGEHAELLRHEALQGEKWRGYFKYRVGDYCVIYQFDRTARLLSILKVGHRREVYD